MDIQPYTFQDAERLQMGSYPVLDTILHRWARQMEETLFDLFKMEIYAGASVVEEMKFSSFYASLNGPKPIYLLELSPFEGNGLVVLDNAFSALCINRGPSGHRSGGVSLTPQNQAALNQAVGRLMAGFDQSWQGVAPVETRLLKLTTYLFRARILNPYEPCLVAQIHLSGEGFSSRMTLCLPRVMLEETLERHQRPKVIPPLNTTGRVKSRPQEAVLEQTSFNMGVQLGMVDHFSVDRLKKGAVLPLAAGAGEVTLTINGQRLLVGQVGEAQGRYAIKVTGSYQVKPVRKVAQDIPFKPVQWPRLDT